jgi:hypothetical protein
MRATNAPDSAPAAAPDRQPLILDQQLLASDLSCVSGTLREVATVWRRAKKTSPRLPLYLPIRLDDAASELAATTAEFVGTGQDHSLDQWCQVAGQLSALLAEIDAARAQTCGAGRRPLGDGDLWPIIDAAMQRAARRLMILIIETASAVDWAVTEPGGADNARLVIRLR